MGCGRSAAHMPAPEDTSGGDMNGDAPGGEWRSKIFKPPGASPSDKPYPALVVVHGAVDEEHGWLAMRPLAEEMAKLGFIVLMVGMPDDDETIVRKYPEAKTIYGKMMAVLTVDVLMKVQNMWPASYYSKALSQAIDHMVKVAPSKLGGLKVDTARIGLVGHSMGGGGVLCAAARDCKDKICAVVALNPSHFGVETPGDNLDSCLQYGSGADLSGEHGEGVVPHLAHITVPTYIYGSHAEYNTSEFGGLCPTWPNFPCVYEQLTGTTAKELYVDNVTDQTFIEAHCRMEATSEGLHSYEGGVPFECLCSFVRRHVAGSSEAVPTKPSNSKEWAVAP